FRLSRFSCGFRREAQSVVAIWRVAQCASSLDEALARLAKVEKHFAEKLPRGNDCAGRHWMLIRCRFEICGGVHHFERLIVLLSSVCKPRRRGKELDLNLIRPVRILALDERPADRRQAVDRML